MQHLGNPGYVVTVWLGGAMSSVAQAMRISRTGFCIAAVFGGFLISLATFEAFGNISSPEQNNVKQKRKEAVNKINELKNTATHHKTALKSIAQIAKGASLNFDVYVYIAELASEFNYHTEPLVAIARHASQAKVETDYFNQLADLTVMKLSETQAFVDCALAVSKLNASKSVEIEKKIEELKRTADFKTLDEAKAYNKLERNKTVP